MWQDPFNWTSGDHYRRLVNRKEKTEEGETETVKKNCEETVYQSLDATSNSLCTKETHGGKLRCSRGIVQRTIRNLKVCTQVLVVIQTTTGPLVWLRDSEENLELWENSMKIFGRSLIIFTLHKGDSAEERQGAVTVLFNWRTVGILETNIQVLVVKKSYHGPTSSTEEHWGIFGLKRSSIKFLWCISSYSLCTREIQLRNTKGQLRDCSIEEQLGFWNAYTGVGSKNKLPRVH